jgi:hypothetical protein
VRLLRDFDVPAPKISSRRDQRGHGSGSKKAGGMNFVFDAGAPVG